MRLFSETDAEYIRSLILDHTEYKPNSAVFLSGGIDSAVMLWALTQKANGKTIHTYTANFGLHEDEAVLAELVAASFTARHRTVRVDYLPNLLQQAQKYLPRAMYNVWPLALVRNAQEDGIENIFLGEGGDEHFGGYPDQTPRYLERWAWQIEGVQLTYRALIEAHGMELHMPLHEIPAKDIIQFYMPRNKWWLRYAFKDILPPEVIFQDSTPPAMTDYLGIWRAQFKDTQSSAFIERCGGEPKTNKDVQEILQKLAHVYWVMHNTPYNALYSTEIKEERNNAELVNGNHNADSSSDIRGSHTRSKKRT